MKIDISRVNLLERDIEDWLHENPSVLYQYCKDNPITGWIGRQYQLPSGIADLIGVRQDSKLVVIEVKNVAINKAAVLQVCRYADDLKCIVLQRTDYPHMRDWSEPVIEMIVVGPSIDPQTFTEAQAVGVRIFQFSAQLTLDISGTNWTHEYRDSRDEQHGSIAAKPEWAIYGLTIAEDIEQHVLEREESSVDGDAVILRGAHLGEGYSDIMFPNGKGDDPL